MVDDITVFVGINVVDVIRIFIIFIYIVRVFIVMNNQLTIFSSQSEDFIVFQVSFFNYNSDNLLDDMNLI